MGVRYAAIEVVLVAVVATAVTAAVLATSPAMASGSSGSSGASPDASTDNPMVWGATVKNTGKQTQLQAVTTFQAKVGRTLGGHPRLPRWDSPFPTAYENGLKAQGTTVLLSVAQPAQRLEDPVGPGGGGTTGRRAVRRHGVVGRPRA